MREPGWLNVDAYDFGQEVVADINQPWFFAAPDSVAEVYIKDGFEHVASAEQFFREAARVLQIGGHLRIWVPHYKSPGAYRVTHNRLVSWEYFQAFPEPFDCLQNLRIVSNRIYFARKEWRIFAPLHALMNAIPRVWERFFYVANVEAVYEKIP